MRSIPRSSSARATPQTSPIASTAPTSWKWTSSGSMPWIRPSAWASRRNASCARARALGKLRGVDLRADGAPVAVGLAGRAVDGGVRRRDAVADGALRRDAESLDPQAREAALDRPGVRAHVEQGAEQHVAGRAADAIEVEQPAHAPPWAERAIRAAMVPAPNPSSMFTTATPAAHEQSMARSALTPPNAAP